MQSFIDQKFLFWKAFLQNVLTEKKEKTLHRILRRTFTHWHDRDKDILKDTTLLFQAFYSQMEKFSFKLIFIILLSKFLFLPLPRRFCDGRCDPVNKITEITPKCIIGCSWFFYYVDNRTRNRRFNICDVPDYRFWAACQRSVLSESFSRRLFLLSQLWCLCDFIA